MKYLKIEDNKGYYLKFDEGSSIWTEIDKINKEDLLTLLSSAIANNFEMDTYSDETLANKAHQIIYKNIYEKFSNILSMKDKFKDESEAIYKEANEKYNIKEESSS